MGEQRTELPPRFMSRVDKTEGCWLWTGRRNTAGYGHLSINKRWFMVHRLSYEHFVGPIPVGFVLDHTCHNDDLDCPDGDECLHRRCVNPTHLEAVTMRENVLRGHSRISVNAGKTHCDHGHEFTPDNTYIYKRQRRCRACLNHAKRNQQYGPHKARSRATQRAMRRLKHSYPELFREFYEEEILKEGGKPS